MKTFRKSNMYTYLKQWPSTLTMQHGNSNVKVFLTQLLYRQI